MTTNRNESFIGKVAFVTGAASGIGRVAALAFAQSLRQVLDEPRRHLDLALVEASLLQAMKVFRRSDFMRIAQRNQQQHGVDGDQQRQMLLRAQHDVDETGRLKLLFSG